MRWLLSGSTLMNTDQKGDNASGTVSRYITKHSYNREP